MLTKLRNLLQPKPLRLSFPQDQEGMNQLVTEFLIENNFPQSKEFRTITAAFLQMSNENEDDFDPALLARRIRKARAKELLFYVIHPEKIPVPQPTDLKEVDEKANGEAAVAVEQKA